MERPAGGGAAPSPCTPLPLVYRHRHAQLRNTTSSTTSHKEATKSTIKAHKRSSAASSLPLFCLPPNIYSYPATTDHVAHLRPLPLRTFATVTTTLTTATLTRLLPIMLHPCDHYHSSLSVAPRARANRLDDSSSSSASSSPSPDSAPLMLLTEPSQKTLAEPLQKTLLRGDGRKKTPDFLVKLQLFGKAPVTVAKNPLPLTYI